MPRDPSERASRLAVLQEKAQRCQCCSLHQHRTRVVWARGNERDPLIAFIGEGPGQSEDETGQPFVGPSGQLLDRMIAAMGLGASEFYVCNVVKCRPPGNRTPSQVESITCRELYLLEQLANVQPRLVIALGRTAAAAFGIFNASWRGSWGTVVPATRKLGLHTIPVLATYHPAYLLREPAAKEQVWIDLQRTLHKLGRRAPVQ